MGRDAEQRWREDVGVSCVMSSVVQRSVHAIDNEGWDGMGQRDSGARSGIAAGEGRHGLGVGWDEVQVGMGRRRESNGLLFARLATR